MSAAPIVSAQGDAYERAPMRRDPAQGRIALEKMRDLLALVPLSHLHPFRSLPE
jgi:hypothetical protein